MGNWAYFTPITVEWFRPTNKLAFFGAHFAERNSDGKYHPENERKVPTWRIIPFSKWLITMVSKSPK